MMKRHLVMLIAIATAAAQQASRQTESPRPRWAPPAIELPSVSPHPTVPKTIVTRIIVAGFPVTLEHTLLQNVAKRFGVVSGHQGDASEAIGWLCFYGKDDGGTWGLWLISGEIDGPMVGGFQWQRLPATETMDRRCKFLDAHDEPPIQLPIDLHLGMTESQVEALVGRPSSKYRGTSIYVHQHSLKLRGEPYSADNSLYLRYNDGALSAVLVNYTISS